MASQDFRRRFAQLEVAPTLANPSIRAYFQQHDFENSEPWTLKPEIPSSEEILGTDSGDCLDLVPNNIDGPWSSKEIYLRAHYDLLREDAVCPLRDAVAYVRQSPHMNDSKVVSIYEKVHIIGMTFAQQGIGFRIQFSTQRSEKKIFWEYSKRLVAGSVIALSPADDVFQRKCIVAIVAARPLAGVQQQPPEIDIYFARPEETEFDPQQEWIMVEAKTGYYEALRHTMTALQKMNRESFPLAENICFLEKDVPHPQYVQECATINVNTLINGAHEEEKVNLLENWPKTPIGDLDETQWEALHQILTKRLAIIQGPPGTGKTFISVVALKAILSNNGPGDPPLLVASQTNHALDQLLTHISNFEPGYIRLGSRSSDPEIKQRTLYAVSRNEPSGPIHGSILGVARARHRSFSQSITELLKAFNQGNSKSPIPFSLFVRYGLLTPSQYDSLVKGAKDWVRPGEQDDADPIRAWLGDQMIKFEVYYSPDNFGFSEDEVDLEYEQLKELEAEYGVEDDDYESLKGPYISIRESTQGLSDVASKKSALNLSKYRDMWKIPVKERGQVYNTLRKSLKEKILIQLRESVITYGKNCQDLQIGKWERYGVVLQKATVIGVTATGLSKYRGLIASMKPRIVLIEEAAEVIEAPIAAACFESIQQMVLVGDHQQLKGHCAVSELEGEPFHLDVSMFERLVCNGLEYVTLRNQRRMAPEIRRLLEPIYGELQDHPSVHDRPSVPGMGGLRSYFFSHDWPENWDSLSSKLNEKEAEMIAEFYLHLVLNGVPTTDITVLTFYNGQRKKLLKLLRDKPYLQGQYMKVVTVDSYQGEENQIVILSLVRSSPNTGIGFLSIQNRVCVALSRARNGFFIFGNAKCLASANPLWKEVINIIGSSKNPRRLGNYLPVTCSNHGKTNHRIGQQRLGVAHFHVAKCFSVDTTVYSYATDLEVFSVADHRSAVDEENLHRAAVESYQAFANGGAQEHDAFLLRGTEAMGPRSGAKDLDLLNRDPKVGCGGSHVETRIHKDKSWENATGEGKLLDDSD
ncbi:hypothetical protein FE257_004766 [Aspergillus nanangensis]|uniref:Helicase required for RNAi-mediated heterochromatin assembly 1 n=1 Tax=Aspergillus nanangensis TaxID=2582783 RepID=A0AAD4CRP4_ASPNN|nr:hypothetical protein FE257_004766 [Aspergillus nanangensis]